MLVEARGLSVSLGGARVLDDVGLTVSEGEVHAFLGPNGAGKTTTLRVLMDLQRPEAGEVRLFGAVVGAEGDAWRGRVGWLRGENALFPFMRAQELLDFLLALSGASRSRRAELLSIFGLNDAVLRRPVGSLSAGMRQAVAIVAALQHDPDLLLLDEPTNALDPIVRARFLEQLRRLRSEGKGILLSSHVLEEVESVADRITLIHRGRVLSTTSMADLSTRLPRRVRVLATDGTSREWIAARVDSVLLRELAEANPAAVNIEDPGLEELFRALGETAA
jgi:ABC-2 type transport system ATP-binding protein